MSKLTINKDTDPIGFEEAKARNVRLTFNSTYTLLMTTGTITFIEALRSTIPEVRHIMNLETCISLVAAYFYSLFIQEAKEAEAKNVPLDYKKLNIIRYNDWLITTPLMILVLSLVLSYNSGVKVKLLTYALFCVLNLGMIGFGYVGDMNLMNKNVAFITSFIFFFLLFGFIGYTFLPAKYSLANYVVFGLFFVVWGMYGVVNKFDEKNKNIGYNILDSIAKCLVGLSLWAYFTKILVL
jgi:bacteriorhodopsin